MRKILAAAALLAVTTAHSAEELKFGDLNYFLKQGQFNVAADATSTFDKESVEGGNTMETRGNTFDTRFAYGINDKMNVFVGLAYAYDREVENLTTTGDSAYSQDGLANPAIGFNFRLKDQSSSDFNLDFGAVARINVQDAQSGSAEGSNTKDGNFANGRSSLELNTRLGKKWNEANEWQFSAGVIYNHDGEYTSKSVDGNEDVELDKSFDIYAKIAYQYRPVETFMMGLSLQAIRIGDLDGEFKKSKVDTEQDAHIDFDLRFEAKYLITDNFIANFHYGYGRNSNYDAKVAGQSFEIKSRRENYFGLGVDFLF